MRIRTIKPEFWRSPDITSLEVADRLLFIGLWSYVDDEGRGADDEAQIIGDLFATDMFRNSTDTSVMVHGGLKRLCAAGLITRYRVGSRAYLAVTNFSSHQVINRPKSSKNPSPDDENAIINDPSLIDQCDVSAGTGNREQGTGNKGTGNSAPVVRVSEDDFERAWTYWPKKTERKKSLEQFKAKARKRIGGVETLIADITEFGQAYEATTEKRFVPSLDVWLRNERWTDELPQVQVAQQQSKASQNAAEYRRLFGGDERSIPAIDAGLG